MPSDKFQPTITNLQQRDYGLATVLQRSDNPLDKITIPGHR